MVQRGRMTPTSFRPSATNASRVEAVARASQNGGVSSRGAGTEAHRSPSERARLGKDARKAAPLDSHADLRLGGDRDPVLALRHQDADRVPELVPIRYGRMIVSPFTFFRGAPRSWPPTSPGTPVSGLDVRLCGDAHLSNFGLFASPERTLVFDINDFDETYPGPWEWDVKRLVASLAVAGRQNGFTDGRATGSRSPRSAATPTPCATSPGMSNLALWYSQLDVDERNATAAPTGPRRRPQAHGGALAKARTPRPPPAMDKLRRWSTASAASSRLRRLVVPVEDRSRAGGDESSSAGPVRGYSRSLDARAPASCSPVLVRAHGAEGRRCGQRRHRAWILLMLGRDDADPLFLQAKEAQASVLESSPAQHVRQSGRAGRRRSTAHAVQRSTSSSDAPGSGIDGEDRDFYVRQLRDWKGSAWSRR